MRIGLLFCLLLSSVLLIPAQAEVYRWVDAEGKVVYGDNPPKQSGAKPVDLPMLTIADSPASTTTPPPNQAEQPPVAEKAAYTEFKIVAPTANEEIRANDGTVMISLSIQPQLQAGDSVALYLDSKQVAAGALTNFSLKEVDRGDHTVFAVLSDATGNIIQNTETVKFTVLRVSVLQKP